MHEDTELAGVQGTAGISRRDMLRKSAVVGGAGALMWAAPSITKFGSSAFGEENDNGTPATDLSNFGAIVRCYDPADPTNQDEWTFYKIKGNYDPETDDFSWEPGDLQNTGGFSLGGCETHLNPDWDNAIKATGDVHFNATIGFAANGVDVVMTIGQPTFEDCEAVVFDGVAASIKQGQCCIGPNDAQSNDTTLYWVGPFPNQEPCTHDDAL